MWPCNPQGLYTRTSQKTPSFAYYPAHSRHRAPIAGKCANRKTDIMRGANDGGTCGRESISRTAIESPRRTASQDTRDGQDRRARESERSRGGTERARIQVRAHRPHAEAESQGDDHRQQARAVRKRMRVLSLQNHTAARQAVASYPEEKAPLHRRRAQRTRDGESLN